MSAPPEAAGAGSPTRSGIDLEQQKSLPTIRRTILGDMSQMRRVGRYAGYAGRPQGEVPCARSRCAASLAPAGSAPPARNSGF
jgi:hypothetical protein